MHFNAESGICPDDVIIVASCCAAPMIIHAMSNCIADKRLFNDRVVKQSLVRTDYILHRFMREKLRAAHDYIARTSVYWTFISTHHHRPHNVSTLFAAEIH